MKEKLSIKKFKDANLKSEKIVYALIDNNSYEGGIVVNIDPIPYDAMDPDIDISWFWISPSLRKKGYGKKLLEKVLDDYKGKLIGLTTNSKTSTPQAINLYKHYGFKVFAHEGSTTIWFKRN